MNVLTRGMRNAFRNMIRTFSIVFILGLCIGLSLTMFVAYRAVEAKVAQVKSVVNNTIDIEPAGSDSFTPGESALTVEQLAKVKSIDHVESLMEMLASQLKTIGKSANGPIDANATTSLLSSITLEKKNHGGSDEYSGGGSILIRPKDNPLPADYSKPVPIVGSTDSTNPTNVTGTSLKIISGKAIDGTKDANNAMVGTDLAKKNNLKIGSTFTAYGATFTVAAIFDAGTEGGNSFVIVPLATQQRLSGHEGKVNSAFAKIDSLDNLSSATAAIKKVLGSAADVTSFVDEGNQALEPLNGVKNVSLYSLIGAIMSGAIIILLTMIMIVRERKREIGVIKAIGFSNLRIMLQFMAEATTLTILGSAVGLVIGFLGANPVTATLLGNGAGGSDPTHGMGGAFVPHGLSQSVEGVHAEVGLDIILYGLVAALLIAIIGSAIASFFIARVRPAEVLRSE